MINKRFWKGKKVLVTGGGGFIGSFVVEKLIEAGAKVKVTSMTGKKGKVKHLKVEVIKADLTNPKHAMRAVTGQRIVLHLAARVAGIGFNIDHPATMFGDNVVMTKNVLDACVEKKVDRVLITSSACVYPRGAKVPTPETEGFVDDPEPTNLGYGWSKRVAELMARFYQMENRLKVAVARPYNAYGPRDDFDPKTSHVIPALIKRVVDGENPLTVWGSGKQTRSFLYVEDLARGLIKTVEKYTTADPVNIGTDEEITIGELAKLIVELTESNTKIRFDKTKPDGQLRRSCDTKKATKKIGFKATIGLREGLARTMEWYKKNQV